MFSKHAKLITLLQLDSLINKHGQRHMLVTFMNFPARSFSYSFIILKPDVNKTSSNQLLQNLIKGKFEIGLLQAGHGLIARLNLVLLKVVLARIAIPLLKSVLIITKNPPMPYGILSTNDIKKII